MASHMRDEREVTVRRRWFDRDALVVAVIISGLGILALTSHMSTQSAVTVATTDVSTVSLLARWAFAFVLSYLICFFIFWLADKARESKQTSANKKWWRSDAWGHRQLIISSIVMLACWLPIMVVRFPGNYDPDTIWELLQTYGYFDLSDHHPWFDTIVFGLFWHLGDLLGSNAWSLALYATLQMVATAVSLSAVSWYLSRFTPRWMPFMFTVFFACFPFVPMTAQTMMKDSFFAWPFVLYALIYCEIIRTKGAFLKDRKHFVLFIVISLLICLTKKTGFYILILCGIVSFFSSTRTCKLKVFASHALVIVLFAVGWQRVALPAMNVAPGNGGEELCVPFQQVGLLANRHSDEFEGDDWQVLSAVFSAPETLGTEYDPLRADNVKAHWLSGASTRDKLSFAAWYIRWGLRHPWTYVQAFFALDYPMFYPDVSYGGDESGLFFLDNKYVEGLSETLASWSAGKATTEMIEAELSSTVLSNTFQRLSQVYDSFYLNVEEALPPLFCKALYASWIPLAALCYCIGRKTTPNRRSLLPILLNTLVLAVGPIVLPRYLSTSVYLAPLCFGLIFSSGADTSRLSASKSA